MTAHRRYTPEQTQAIREYRKATYGGDFTALLQSVTELAKAGLYESEATEAIAMGYVGGDNEGEDTA